MQATGVFWSTVALRTAYGLVVGTTLANVRSMSVDHGVALLSATYPCGLALGLSLDRAVVLQTSRKLAVLLSVLLFVAGIVLTWQATELTWLLPASFLVAMGIRPDWSSAGEAARDSLPAKKRWNYLRWSGLALPCAIIAALLISPGVSLFAALTLACGAATVIALQCLPEGSVTEDAEEESRVQEPHTGASHQHTDTAEASSTATQRASEVAEQNNDDPSLESDCEETECCGGGLREIIPTAFAHGVVLSAIGHIALWGCLFGLLRLAGSDILLISCIGMGLAAGHVLLTSSAPATGYCVAMLPFLLVGVPVMAVSGFLEADSSWMRLVMLIAAGCTGGTIAGFRALEGELFTDTKINSARTRIITTGLFAGSAVVLVLGYLPVPTAAFGFATMFFIGLLAVRSIPGPIISSKGTDQMDDDTREEAQDIVNALNSR